MKVVMRIEVVVTEERELEITQKMCDTFCEYFAESYKAEFEPITPEEIEKYNNGEESKLDQVAIFGGKEMQLAGLWNNWIREELWDGDYYELDRDCINENIYYEA